MILDALALLGANACVLLAGVGVLRLAAGDGVFEGWASLGLAYVVGLASVGVVATLMLVGGLALTVPQVLALCAGLLVLGLARGRPARLAAAMRSVLRRPASLRPLALLVAAFLVLLAVDFAFQPLFRADAWAQWGARARALVLLDGLDPSFFAGATTIQNPDYPLLLPAVEAIAFRFMGINTQVLHLQFWLLLAGFLVAVAALLRGRVSPGILWPVLAAIAVAPTVAIQTASAYADVPLAAFFAVAGVCAWRWLTEGGGASLALLTLFSAACVATKVEGLLFAGAIFLLLVPLVARRSLLRAAITVAAGSASLVGIIPWRLWVREHGVQGDFSVRRAFSGDVLADGADGLPQIVWSLVRELLDPTSWLLLLPLALAAAVLALRSAGRRDGAVLAVGVFGVSVVGLVWTYWTTPFELDQHLRTSSERVVIAPVLFLAALAPALLAQALAREEARIAVSAPPSAELVLDGRPDGVPEGGRLEATPANRDASTGKGDARP